MACLNTPCYHVSNSCSYSGPLLGEVCGGKEGEVSFRGLSCYNLQVLLEIIICIGLVKFIQLSVLLCGGHDNLVNLCRKRNTKLPIGSPPFVCLLPFRKPKVSRMNLNLMIFAPALLLAVKIIILVIDLIFLCIGYIPSGDFIAYDNLHHIIAFPVGLFAIYCYTMFNFIMNDCLEGNNKRFLGIILLLEFILFDCLRLFFIFLTGISYYRITMIYPRTSCCQELEC